MRVTLPVSAVVPSPVSIYLSRIYDDDRHLANIRVSITVSFLSSSKKMDRNHASPAQVNHASALALCREGERKPKFEKGNQTPRNVRELVILLLCWQVDTYTVRFLLTFASGI